MGGREIDEAQIRYQHALLRHEGFSTIVHCQKVGETSGIVDRKLVTGVDAVLQFAAEQNGRGNVFISRNPRSLVGEKLGAITSFSFDIDPDREKGTAATKEQRQAALSVARRILAALPGGALLDSGNGYQIFYTWAPFVGEETSYEMFAKKAALWSKQYERFAVGTGCTLDRIHDNSRLVKLAGTLSVKGTEDQWRVASFGHPLPVVRDCRFVFDRINGTALPVSTALPSSAVCRPFEDEVVLAARALSRLSPVRGDNYSDWLRVGMALRHLGDAGLALWENWSKRRRGYEEGACSAKWDTFDPCNSGEGVTVGSLVHWAESDTGGAAASAPTEESPLLDAGTYLQKLPARLRGEGVHSELTTGIPELDAFGPLLLRGSVLTIGALTDVGKTALALTLAAKVAKDGKRVLVFSTETQPDEIFDRLVLVLGGTKDVKSAEMALKGIAIDVSDGFEPNAAAVEEAIKASKPDVFVFDHLQHIGSESDESRVREISRFVAGVHDIARRHNCAAILTSQLNRNAAQPGIEPSLRHLKDCSTIEHESRAVLLLKRLDPNLSALTFPVGCTLAKNKGPKGTCQLLLNTQASRFESMIGGQK